MEGANTGMAVADMGHHERIIAVGKIRVATDASMNGGRRRK
jgi:hypothetical protein